ncbi:MAG: pilus assembly protein PilM [bacterium]
MAKKSILGIDLDDESIKLVEVFASGETANQVIEYFPPPELSANLVKSIQSVIKKSLAKVRLANVAISGHDIAYFVIDLPPMAEKEKAEALKYKLGILLPYPVEEADFSFNKIPITQINNKEWYLVVAIPKKRFTELYGALRKAGLSPAEIIPGAVALKNLSPETKQGAYSIIYFNKYVTNIVLVKEAKVVFVREVKVGTEELVQSMVGVVAQTGDKLEIDQEKAREIIQNFGIPLGLENYSQAVGLPGDVIIARIRPVLEKMGAEILRTFDYYKEKTGDQTEFSRSYFTGEATMIIDFVEYFKQSLQLDILPLESPAKSGKINVAVLAKAIGAAKTGKKEISLFPSRYKHPIKYFISRLINYTSISIVYLLLLAAVFVYFASQAGELEKHQAGLNRKLIQQREKNKNQLQANPGLAEAVRVMGITKEQPDRFVLLMEKLDRLTPSEVSLVELIYDRRTNSMTAKGVVVKGQQSQLVNQFINELRADKLFTGIDLNYLRETDRFSVPTYEFEIKTTLLQGEKF